MPDNKHTVVPLQKISEIINQLDEISKRLMENMDEQIKSIITSEAEKIAELTEVHTVLRAKFKQIEQSFVAELSAILNSNSDTKSIRLSALKTIFPSYTSRIDQWKESLAANTTQLQRKQQQLLQLLEFAMSRNADMMRSIYSVHNRKNAQYSANGNKTGTVSGVAINQEV